MHHVSLAMPLDSWCLLNVPIDRRVWTFLSPGTRTEGMSDSGCASSHSGISGTLHAETPFPLGLIQTFGNFLYISVTLLYFLRLWKNRQMAENMETLLPLGEERTRCIFIEPASLRWVFIVSVADLTSAEHHRAAQGEATILSTVWEQGGHCLCRTIHRRGMAGGCCSPEFSSFSLF